MKEVFLGSNRQVCVKSARAPARHAVARSTADGLLRSLPSRCHRPVRRSSSFRYGCHKYPNQPPGRAERRRSSSSPRSAFSRTISRHPGRRSHQTGSYGPIVALGSSAVRSRCRWTGQRLRREAPPSRSHSPGCPPTAARVASAL